MAAQYTPELDKLMRDVREASYYDSTQLFTIGESVIKKAIQAGRPDAVAEVYLYYGNYFYYVSNAPQAMSYHTKAINQGKATGNRHIEELASIRLEFTEHEQGLRDDIEQEFQNRLKVARQGTDYENTAELINLMGVIKEEYNQLKEAAQLYLEGLSLAETHHLTHYTGVFRNNLGLVKIYTQQYDDALGDFEKGLAAARHENSQHLINHIMINISVVYISQNNDQRAIPIFNQVLDFSRRNNRPRELGSTFINLSGAFVNSGKPDIALTYIDSAIDVFRVHHLYPELDKAYLGKASVLLNVGRNKEARENLEQARLLSDKSGSLENKASYFMLLYRADEADKNYKEALDHFLSYQKLSDSIEQTLNGKIIQGLQLRYNVQKKEIELEKERSRSLQLETVNQQERFMKWLFVGISAIVLVLLISFIWLRYSRKLREKQEQFSRLLIQNTEDERARISQDLHDDIGQSLSIIKSKIAKLGHEPMNDQQLEQELGRVIEQTREISHNLFPSYLEKIGLVRSVARLVENIQQATHIECSFEITDDVEQCPISVKTHIYRIIQECTSNTIRHAGASALKISIFGKQNEYQLVYQDNGQGMDLKDKAEGMGLLSIRERARIIGGIVTFDDKHQKGFKLIMKFKPLVP